MPFETIQGMKIYYEVHGEGDTMVLLHHGFGCTKMWKDIYPSLVAAGYRVVMYDRRGYGRSGREMTFRSSTKATDSARRASGTWPCCERNSGSIPFTSSASARGEWLAWTSPLFIPVG